MSQSIKIFKISTMVHKFVTTNSTIKNNNIFSLKVILLGGVWLLFFFCLLFEINFLSNLILFFKKKI